MVDMSAPAYRHDHDTVIPLDQAPALAELAGRVRRHERITLTEQGKPAVAIIAADELEELQAAQDVTDVARAEAIKAQGGPRVPHALVLEMMMADDATYEAMEVALAARQGEDIAHDEQWAMWRAVRANRSG